MRNNFRQGIITYPSTGANQTFLVATGGSVSLRAGLSRVDIAFAHGGSNYLLTESTDIDNAWGPLPANTDCWLYWEINPLTGARTFGHTTIPPISSSSAPTTAFTGQMWFDTASTTMYVYTSASSRRVAIRVFAAKVNNNVFSPLGTGVAGKPFAGTQAGLSSEEVAIGRIIADDTGTPIRRPNGTLFTTEDDFFVDSSPVNAVRIDATVVNGEALEPMAKFQVVKFSEFGKFELASYNDIQTTAIAMLLEDLTINSVGTVCVQGKIINPEWNWSTVGAELWVSEAGLLTEVDPHVANAFVFPIPKPPVGRVLTPDTIIFDQGLGGKGERGAPGLSGGVALATTVVHGVSRLSVPAATTDDPVVVGTNDPRLTDKVFRSGDTMTGPLILNADPTQPLGAAPKQYVDSRTLDSLADVATTGAAVSNVLVFNGTNWVAGAVPSAGASALNDLTDVTLTSMSSGDHLVYNGSQWVNQTPVTPPPFPDVPEVLNDLDNVNTTGAVTGNALVFNGTNWVPGSLPSVEGDDNLFVFQVGTVIDTEHIHFTPVTSAQVQLLVDGTDPTLPVGSEGQPSVTITSSPNGNPGDAEHTHEVTIVYDYVNQTFEVVDISNNSLDNHEALLIGKPSSGGGSGDSLWQVGVHEYPSHIVGATAGIRVNTNDVPNEAAFLSMIMSLPEEPGGAPYTVTLVVDGVRRQGTVLATNTNTVQSIFDALNATPLGDYATVGAVHESLYGSRIVFTGVPGVTSLVHIQDDASDDNGDPFIAAANSYVNWFGYQPLTPTLGEYFEKTTEALMPILDSEPIQEVLLNVNTYVDSDPVQPLTYSRWTNMLAHIGERDDLRLNAIGGAIGQPGSSNGFATAARPAVYMAANVDSVNLNNYGNRTPMVYIEARTLNDAVDGGSIFYNDPLYDSTTRIALYEQQSVYSDMGTYITDIAVGNAVGDVYALLYSTNESSQRRMTIVSLNPHLNAAERQFSFTPSGDVNIEGSAVGRMAVNQTNNHVAAAWSFVDWDNGGEVGFTVTLQNMNVDEVANIWTRTSRMFDNNLGLTDIAVDPTTGDVIVLVGSYYNERFSYLVRFAAATGDIVWEHFYEDGTNSPLFTGLAVDGDTGNIFLGGTYYTGDDNYNGLLVSLNSAGVQNWAVSVDALATGASLYSRNNNRVRLALDSNSVYMAYAVDQAGLVPYATDIWVGSFGKTSSTLNWQSQVGNQGSHFYSQFDVDLSEGGSQGNMAVYGNNLVLTFTSFAGAPNHHDIYYPRTSTVTMSTTGPATGVNPSQYSIRPAAAVIANGVAVVPAPVTTPLFVPNLATNPSMEVSSSISQGNHWVGAIQPDRRAPGVGVEIPPIVPSLEVANSFKAGSLSVGDLLPPPTTLVGDIRDVKGMMRVAEAGIWYCFANYNGVTNVWKFAPFDQGAKVFQYYNQSITAQLIHQNNIVIMNSDSAVEYRLPEDDSMFPIGTTIVLGQSGSGQVSVVSENSYSITILSPETNRTRKQNAKITLFKIDEGEWHLEGNLEAEDLVPPGGPPVG